MDNVAAVLLGCFQLREAEIPFVKALEKKYDCLRHLVLLHELKLEHMSAWGRYGNYIWLISLFVCVCLHISFCVFTHTSNKHRTNLRPHRPKWKEVCSTSHTKIERPTSGSGIDIINTVRQMKWSWAGHINRLKDDRWTSSVTTWRPYDKKRRQGRPAMRWRDDLDKYWSDTIWQRTAQDRVIWRRHMLRPSPNHGTQRLLNDDDDDTYVHASLHSCMTMLRLSCNTGFVNFKIMITVTFVNSSRPCVM